MALTLEGEDEAILDVSYRHVTYVLPMSYLCLTYVLPRYVLS